MELGIDYRQGETTSEPRAAARPPRDLQAFFPGRGLSLTIS